MRFGVIGLGSMGKRRARDLVAQGHSVAGFDIRPDRMTEARSLYGIDLIESAEALVDDVDAVVISTPPDAHVPMYELCYSARRDFFSEASILTPTAAWFAQHEQAAGVRGYPSSTWQFYPPLALLRERVHALGQDALHSLHHHYAGWLPSWHPWEHYGDFYAGRSRATSAAREMVPFEMEWLCWIAGPVHRVSAAHRQAHRWETDIDDQYTILLEYESGVIGSLTIELHQVAPFRMARVSCDGQAFRLDFARHEVEWYTQSSDSWRYLRSPGLRAFAAFNFEDVYFAEIAAFAAAVRDRVPSAKSWADDRHLSTVLFAAEESARRGTAVTVADAELLYDGLTV